MLEIALLYEEELKYKFHKTWFNDKYKYYHNGCYYPDFSLDTDTWNRHQFVSLDDSGDVIGYIGYDVNRQTHSAGELGIVNFSDKSSDKLIFARDLMKVLDDIFVRFNFNKLVFSVVVGNPIEVKYDRLIHRFGGRIVGVYKQDTKLFDGTICDLKVYEIFKDNYLNYK